MDEMALGYAMGQDSNNNCCCNNGNGMFGGDGSWIFAFLIIALIFGGRGIFGGWGGGYGGGIGDIGVNSPAGQGALTRADLCSEFNFNNLDNAVRGIQNGLCDGFYALNNSVMNGFHGVDNAVCQLGYQTQQGFNANNVAMLQGFNGVDKSLCQLGYNLQDCCCQTQRSIDGVNYNQLQNFTNLGNQLNNCCCETQRQIERGFCDVGYNMATNTSNIIQNAHNDTDRVIAKLDAMESARQAEKIQALQIENQGLKFAASQASQNAFITANQEAQTAEIIRRLGRDCPVPAYVVPNPNCCYGNGYGFNNGCGCGCGCGC